MQSIDGHDHRALLKDSLLLCLAVCLAVNLLDDSRIKLHNLYINSVFASQFKLSHLLKFVKLLRVGNVNNTCIR